MIEEDRCEMSRQYSKHFEHEKWADELPWLNFKNEWKVKIIPPFGRAIIRFLVSFNNKEVSVYFDGYNLLGFTNNIPYFEIYDGKDTERFLINETDELLNAISKMLED